MNGIYIEIIILVWMIINKFFMFLLGVDDLGVNGLDFYVLRLGVIGLVVSLLIVVVGVVVV